MAPEAARRWAHLNSFLSIHFHSWAAGGQGVAPPLDCESATSPPG
jgi:hypothetical protein